MNERHTVSDGAVCFDEGYIVVFSSITFLCVFLPISFILYYLVPGLKLKNILLLFVSLIFYTYGEPKYVLLMIVSIFLTISWVY